MQCYLCGGEEHKTRSGRVRDDPKIKILECNSCGLVFLSSRSHIIDGHYEKSGMHDKIPDIQSWLNETRSDDQRRYNFLRDKILNQNVLDFGCGAGGFMELAKSSSDSISGVELEEALQPSFNSRGLTVFRHLESAKASKKKWEVITCFHVVEHLLDPIDVLHELSSMLKKGGEIVIEVPSADDALLTLFDNQAFQGFTYWSQHLYLFNANTMRKLIEKAGLKLNWIKHIQRYSLANHLYWLANGEPGGHKHWAFMDDNELNKQYEQQLAALGLTDTIIASISL